MQTELAHFLPDFGTPIFRALREVGRDRISFKDHLQYPVDVLLSANTNMQIAVLFTPNGNYGQSFEDGKPLAGVVTKSSQVYPPKFNALYVDLDIKQTVCKDWDELFLAAINVWKILGIDPTWVVKKNGGPHIFWIIDPEDREEIDKTISIDDFEYILKYLSKLFTGGDTAPCRLNAFMRLPNTYHRKVSNIKNGGVNPIKSKLFQWYDDGLQDEYNLDKKNYIKLEHILALKELSVGYKDVVKDTRETIKYMGELVRDSVKRIQFADMIAALEKYPRVFKSRKSEDDKYNGMLYSFFLEGSNINLKFEDGSIIKTKGYKLNDSPVGKNGFTGWDISYINNFSQTDGVMTYDSYERPRGNVFSFMRNYFGGDMKKILLFLKKEFDIEITNIDITKLGDEDKVLKWGDNTLLCNKNGVFLEYQKTMPKGQTLVLIKQIFDTPLIPIGYMESKMNDDLMETTEINKIYIFYDQFNNRRITLKRFNTKAAFNKFINKIGIHCFAEEDLVANMFSILDHSHLPKITEISHNGVYEDFVLLGGQVIYKTQGYDSDNYHINTTFKYDIAHDAEQITPHDFCTMMLECFDEKFVFLPILQLSAMMLMNVWKDALRIPIYPALLFTGETGKGKSSIVDILKAYAGYGKKSRELSLGGRSSSAQPVRQSATDNSILFLEELTGIVNPAAEQSIRGIINRDTGSIGMTGGKNAIYNFRSPILALGQRTFTEDSINNRFLILDMDHQKKRGTQTKLNQIKKYSCYKYVYEKYYENPDLIKSLYEKYAEQLIESNLIHRARDVIMFVFIMNDFLELNIPFNKLMEHVNWHLRNVGLEKPQQEVSPELIFKSVLISGFMKHAIFGTFTDIDKNSKTRYELHFSDEYLEQNRAKIYSSIAFFNDKAKEEGKNDVMYMISNMLVITVTEVAAGRVDEVLDMIMKWLTKATKGVLTYVPTL